MDDDVEELIADAADLLDRWERAETDQDRLKVGSDMAGLLAAVPHYLGRQEA